MQLYVWQILLVIYVKAAVSMAVAGQEQSGFECDFVESMVSVVTTSAKLDCIDHHSWKESLCPLCNSI